MSPWHAGLVVGIALGSVLGACVAVCVLAWCVASHDGSAARRCLDTEHAP